MYRALPQSLGPCLIRRHHLVVKRDGHVLPAVLLPEAPRKLSKELSNVNLIQTQLLLLLNYNMKQILLRLDKIASTLDAILRELQSLREDFNARFDKLEARFDNLDARFDNLDAKFDNLEAKMGMRTINRPASNANLLIRYPHPFVPGGPLPSSLAEARKFTGKASAAALKALEGAPGLRPLPSKSTAAMKKQHLLDYLGYLGTY